MAAFIQWQVKDASEEAVSRALQFDLSWTGTNGRLETSELEKYVAKYAATGEQRYADQALVFYQVLQSRLNTWSAGGFRIFLDRSPERTRRFEELGALIHELESQFANLSEPEAQQTILRKLEQASPLVNRIGGEAHSESIAEASEVRQRLQQRHFLDNVLSVGLIAISGLLLVAMSFLNHWLRQAHRRARDSADAFAHQARHDALTGLPNRFAFGEALKGATAGFGTGQPMALFVIDLDGFKPINDALGHAAGDELLQSVARRVRGVSGDWGSCCQVFRLGGDEFTVLMKGECASHRVIERANELLAALRKPHKITTGNIIVDATIGVARSDAEMTGSDEIFVDADLALSRAKALGKGIALEYEPSMHAELRRRSEIEAALPLAIHNGEIFPYYQPQVDMISNRIVGVEALARWRHPSLGWISPGEFIPIAESSGRICDVGQLILTAACESAMQLPADIRISVNISVAQLIRYDVVDLIKNVLERSGLAPARLKLEVTESIFMKDGDRIFATLRALKAIGVGISLDDFGTGYSALSYLQHFAWDELKIDRQFVRSLEAEEESHHIVDAVASLAGRLGIPVTAEGIETREQHLMLRARGCKFGQGYLYGKPMTFDALRQAVKEDGHARNVIPSYSVV
ncbi:EAL domain-containing protein [Stappia sp. F7233]|uniref:EAL domain-containing protein n=1 Tax=Stappia albiluteola TaxID=2758565 RepID=A0A839AK32_9HYPH|nr:EAL domain-containing protein [Stappia albiluteola]MBA5779252.1 EAL domain-containing protein [Stappia albiluteola]